MSANPEEVPAEQLAKLKQLGAILNKSDATPEELTLVLTKLGIDAPPPAQVEAMLKHVSSEVENLRKPLDSTEPQAVLLPKGDDDDLSSCTVRALGREKGLLSDLGEQGGNTLYEALRFAVDKYSDKPWLGTRAVNADGTVGAYTWETYGQVYERIVAVGAALCQMCELKSQDMVGINLKTSAEWTIAHQANQTRGLVTVTLYDTFGEEALQYIVDKCSLKVVLCGPENLDKMLKISTSSESVQFVVCAGEVSEEQRAQATKGNTKLITYAELEAYGRSHPLEIAPPQPSDLSFICFTSGTTGMPKGVMHTHSSIVASVAGGLDGPLAIVSSDDVHIAFLPLAHIMELWLESALLMRGASWGYYQGDTLKLLEDVAVLKPTLFIAVPRLLNRIYDKVSAAASQVTGVKAVLSGLAREAKASALAQGRVRSLWDFVVFNKVSSLLGGRVRFIASGSAPIAARTLAFYRLFFSAVVIEGYGSSEVLVTSLTLPNDFNPGSVGPPMAHTEMKLVSVPEMEYLVTDQPCPRGEVCYRGPSVMKGYYGEEEKTAEVLDKEGWYHTGDVGTIQPNGTLKILDRAKNIFKLAQGEYVAPEKIENVMSRSPFVAQSFVYGHSLESAVVAIVVPDQEFLTSWAEKNGTTGDYQALCENADVAAAVLKDITRIGRENKLFGFEIVRAIKLHSEPFSAENDLLTPTFKLKRFQARKRFQADLDALYAQVNSI